VIGNQAVDREISIQMDPWERDLFGRSATPVQQKLDALMR
jgi:hypothetical protein